VILLTRRWRPCNLGAVTHSRRELYGPCRKSPTSPKGRREAEYWCRVTGSPVASSGGMRVDDVVLVERNSLLWTDMVPTRGDTLCSWWIRSATVRWWTLRTSDSTTAEGPLIERGALCCDAQ
jgi:hypothetical protein